MLIQPTNELPTPEALTKHLDSVKNTITLAEAEVARLRDLRISEEVTIIEKNKQKVYAEEQLNAALANLAYTEAEGKKNETKIIDQRIEIVSLRVEKDALAQELTGRENACAVKETELNDREYALNTRSNEVNTLTKSVQEREETVIAKEKKIKEFVETI